MACMQCSVGSAMDSLVEPVAAARLYAGPIAADLTYEERIVSADMRMEAFDQSGSRGIGLYEYAAVDRRGIGKGFQQIMECVVGDG